MILVLQHWPLLNCGFLVLWQLWYASFLSVQMLPRSCNSWLPSDDMKSIYSPELRNISRGWQPSAVSRETSKGDCLWAYGGQELLMCIRSHWGNMLFSFKRYSLEYAEFVTDVGEFCAVINYNSCANSGCTCISNEKGGLEGVIWFINGSAVWDFGYFRSARYIWWYTSAVGGCASA